MRRRVPTNGERRRARIPDAASSRSRYRRRRSRSRPADYARGTVPERRLLDDHRALRGAARRRARRTLARAGRRARRSSATRCCSARATPSDELFVHRTTGASRSPPGRPTGASRWSRCSRTAALRRAAALRRRAALGRRARARSTRPSSSSAYEPVRAALRRAPRAAVGDRAAARPPPARHRRGARRRGVPRRPGRTAKRLLELAGDADQFTLPVTQEELAGDGRRVAASG